MKSIKRDTKLKMAHNPTGELMRAIVSSSKFKRFAVRLRAFCAALSYALLLASCTTDLIYPPTCPGGCEVEMIWPASRDINGFYHIPLDWTGEYYPYFYVDLIATPTDPLYFYNDDPVVEARFDSNTSWIIGDSLVITVANYSPFGDFTSNGLPLPVGYTDLTLSQFKGQLISIAQKAPINFSYHNGINTNELRTRRYLGPFPPTMLGDTITVYMETSWDAGMNTTTRSDYVEKFIVE